MSQRENRKNNIIISGDNEDNEDANTVVTELFQIKLQISGVRKCKWLELIREKEGKNRLILVTMSSFQDKFR